MSTFSAGSALEVSPPLQKVAKGGRARVDAQHTMLVLLRAPLAAPTTTLPSLEPNTLQPFGFPPATAVPHDECAVVLARPSETVLELFALGADRALHHRRRAAAGSECSCSWRTATLCLSLTKYTRIIDLPPLPASP